MISEPQTASLFAREQFRMTRLQVYNWGTFSGLHDVPISERGFLFVGRSGAGKSTLLDAFSALLVPPRWIDFNAAAREADRSGRDRNLVTYVRGAWAEQKDGESGEIATHGLAILHRARSYLPNLQSVLMDEDTLLRHKALWVDEKEQHPAAELTLLTEAEQALYQGLKQQLWGQNVRLEQERIRWDAAWRTLQSVVKNQP